MMASAKVLFVCEKWAECDPAHGPSNAHHNFIGSFVASGAGPHESFFFDEHVWRTKEPCDTALLARVRASQPDLIFVTPVRGSDLNPTRDTIARLRRETGARVVVLNGDTCDEAGVRWCENFAPVVDRIIVQDCYSLYPMSVRDPSKYLALWTPLDPALFYRGTGERSIDVSFLGSIARYPDRKRAIGVLAEAGIPVTQGGGQAEGALSVADYAAILRRSKIVLNFARAVFEAPQFQCKGRVVEAALSGALLIEQANPETEHWLTPGEHYAAFGDERDLVDVVRYYLAHENDYWRRVLDEIVAPVRA
jgi:hypothetical protein